MADEHLVWVTPTRVGRLQLGSWIGAVLSAAAVAAGPVVAPKPAAIPPPAPSGPPMVADSLNDAAELNGHVFQVVKRRLTWAEADAACRKAGGHLAVITSAAEQDLILGPLDGPVYPRYARWIGLSVGAGGAWEWSDGSAVDYVRWAAGDGAATGGRAGRLSGHGGGTWEAAPADERNWYLCEWDRPGAAAHRKATAPVIPPPAVAGVAPAPVVAAAVPRSATAKPAAAGYAGFLITIDAKCGAASTKVSLGAVHEGQVLTFSYVSGGWTAFPARRYPPSSPDAVPLAHENVLPLRLCENADGAVTQLAELPGGTHDKPFTFVVPHDVADLVLNNRDARPDNNQGSVVYRVTGVIAPRH